MSDETPPNCCVCGEPAPVHFMCDEVDGIWCPNCFPGEQCEREHGEGCATKVFCG